MNLQSILQFRKALRNGLERHWLILVLFTIYMSSAVNRSPHMVQASFAAPVFAEAESTSFSYWGDVSTVAQGHTLVNPKKNNKFPNIAFLVNTNLSSKKGVTSAMKEVNNRICTNYVRRFASVARSEMNKYGIPASITLAQGLLESDAGGSRLSRKNNNHFGMKCFSRKCNKSHCSNFTDDSHKDFFRIYENTWQSYRAHSKLLQGKRYAHLKNYGKDYNKWAFGLRKAGYATDKRYAQKLIAIIEALKLYEFDAN